MVIFFFISALIVSYFICGLLVYVTIIVMDNEEARIQAQRNSKTMQRFKAHVVNDMVSDEHTDEGLNWINFTFWLGIFIPSSSFVDIYEKQSEQWLHTCQQYIFSYIDVISMMWPLVSLQLIVFYSIQKDHTDDLKLFEQKLMLHFNPQFMDEEHRDHQATGSHWFATFYVMH